MADRPIIFSAPMVRALLEGRKTQTRRIVKPRGANSLFDGSWSDRYVLDEGNQSWRDQEMRFASGDRLWVRENWRTSVCVDGTRASVLETLGNGYGWPVWYAADSGAVTWRGATDGGYGFINPGKLRPSIFMPRWASRLTLVVTEVRVERLQDISEADAIAEGAAQYASSTKLYRSFEPELKGCYRAGFLALWDHLNGPESTDANPWVAAITFEVHRANIDKIPSPVVPTLAQGDET